MHTYKHTYICTHVRTYITLHYITLHYITLHYINIHTAECIYYKCANLCVDGG